MDQIHSDYEALKQELEEFQQEKERIRRMIGSIGGERYSHRDNIFNIVFLVMIMTLFTLEITAKILPSMISIELSVFLVSVKIVWMMHQQHRYNHFVFWILNTIEFRVNQVNGAVVKMQKSLETVKNGEEK